MIKTYSINEEFLKNLRRFKELSGLKNDSTAIQQAVFLATKFFLPTNTPIRSINQVETNNGCNQMEQR